MQNKLQRAKARSIGKSTTWKSLSSFDSRKEQNRFFGKSGEDFAVNYLQKKGYKILARNFRSKFGEIDIVAKEAETLVFVEVKTRNNKKYGLPYEAVNNRKLEKIKQIGEYYCLKMGIKKTKMRVDVLSLLTKEGGFQAELIQII